MSVTLNDIKAKFDPENRFWDKAIQYLIDSGLYSDPLLDAPYADGSLPATSGGIRVYTNGLVPGSEKGVALDVILAGVTSAIGAEFDSLKTSATMPDGASLVGFNDTTAYSWLNSGSVHTAIVNLADRINSIVISGGGGSGTVTSVGLTAPLDIFTVSGSPVTDSGDLGLGLANQNANLVFAGPVSGSAATPSFRSIATQDLPSGIDASKIGSGNISNTEFDYLNGTSATIQTQFNTLTNNLSTSSSVLQNQINATSNSLSAYLPLSGGSLSGDLNGTNISASGNVSASNVYLTNAIFSDKPSSATFYAGPISGVDSDPTFRALSASDIPSGIDATKIGSGNVDNTEFSYLNGTSATIQTQLNTLTTNLSTSSSNLQNQITNTNNSLSAYLPLSGGTLTGNLSGTNISASGNVSATGMYGDHFDFPTDYSPVYKEGRLFYDNQNKCLTIYNDISSSSLQIGRENWIRVRNRTGQTLTDGTAVYVSSAIGQVPTVTPAVASDSRSSMILGLVTHDILDNGFGEVVSFGLINNIDTSMFVEGDYLYLSPTSAGKLTNIRPTAPNYAVSVGVVVYPHNTQGTILVHPDTNAHLGYGTANQLLGVNSTGVSAEYKTVSGVPGSVAVNHSLNNISLEVEFTSATKDPTGFVNRTDSTISFTSATRTFTISGTFDIYVAGKKYTKTTENIQITSAAGPHFIFYNTSATLVETQTPWSLLTDVPVCLVYWTSAGPIVIAEERHGLNMDSMTHYYLHHTFGTRYVSGFSSTYTLNSDTSAGFGVSNGAIADEDIFINVTDGTVNGNFRQPINYPGSFPVYYRVSNSTGGWRKDPATAFPYKNNGAGTRINYNQLSGTSWVQTQAGNGERVAYFIYATDDINEPIISVQGQRSDLTLADAENNNTPLTLQTGDFPFQEAKLLYRLIVQTSNAYTGNDYRARIEDVLDYRSSLTSIQSTAGGTGTVTSVFMTVPSSIMTVSGSPVTNAGSLDVSLINQTSATVFAGPISGSNAQPTFRSLSASDIPSGIDATKIGSGTIDNTEFSYLNGTSATIQTQFNTLTTNLSTSSSNLQNQITNTSNSLSAYLPLSGGTLTGTLNGTNISASGNVSAANAYLTSIIFATKPSSSTFYAGPISGASADPVFRTISASDIPSGIAATKIGSGNVDNTEFDYLNGTSASIQTQFNTLTTNLSTSSSNLQNQINSTNNSLSAYLPLSGGSMTGQLNSVNLSAVNLSASNVFVDGVLRVSSAGAATFTSATVSNLTPTRVVFAGPSGILQDDAGLSYSTNQLTIGQNSETTASWLLLNTSAGANKDIYFATSGTLRWVIRSDNTTESGSNAGSGFQIIARNDAGSQIDVPISIIRTSAGLMTFGGVTNRTVNFTGAIQVAGSTIVTSARAATFTSATISNLSSGRVPFSTTGGLLTDYSGFLFDSITNILTVGTGSTSAFLVVDSSSGQTGGVALRTGSSSRWSIRKGNAVESGSDAGSPFELVARTDTATEIDSPISIVRATTGTITIGGNNRPTNFTGPIQVSGTTMVTLSRDVTIASLGVNIAATPATGLILTQYDTSATLGIQATYTQAVTGASIITANSTGTSAADQILLRGRSTAVNRFLVYANGDIDYTGNLRVSGTTIVTSARAATFTSATISNLSSGRIPVVGTAGFLQDDAGLTYTRSGSITTIVNVGDGVQAATAGLALRSPVGQRRVLAFDSGTSARWRLLANTTAESGSNAGSDFVLEAYTDAGASIDNPLTITRAAGGSVLLTRPLLVSAAIATSTLTSGRVTYATTNGALTDNASLLFDGTQILTIGSNASTGPRLNINGATAQFRGSEIFTAASPRWFFGVDNTAESGSDAGSDFIFRSRSDAGASTGNAIVIQRATGGTITLNRILSCGAINATTVSATTFIATSNLVVSGSLDVSGSMEYKVSNRSSDASTSAAELVIRYTGTGGHTETIPLATGTGRILIFKHVGTIGGLWTVARSGSDTIEGEPSIVLDASGSVTLIDSASGLWEIIG